MLYDIIVIGDELLIGQVADTNSGWISRHLKPYGWEVKKVLVIGDNENDIVASVEDCMAEVDAVLVTGGLGPTKDDITKGSLKKCFGGEICHSQEVEDNVRKIFEKRGIVMNELTLAQADVPTSCRVIQNQVGTAPIMWFEREGKVLVSMPGVPFETETMMEREVIPQLISRFNGGEDIEFRTFVVAGIPESDLAIKLNDFENELPEFLHLAYLPDGGIVRLRLSGALADSAVINDAMDTYGKKLQTILGDAIICCDDEPLAQIIGKLLRSKHLTLSTAESCTGGNIAHAITEIAGSSEYFVGSVVSYTNGIKHKVLNVQKSTLSEHGAVSQPTVEQMACGVSELMGTDCAVSTSGIAGPGGAEPGKPVGTVWIAAKFKNKVVSHCFLLPGNRERVIKRATTEALLLLYRLINGIDTAL